MVKLQNCEFHVMVMTFSTDQTQQLSCYIEDAIVSHNHNTEILSALNF